MASCDGRRKSVKKVNRDQKFGIWDKSNKMIRSIVLTICSQPKWRVSLLVFHIHVGAATEKQLYKLEVALVGGNGQSRVPGAWHGGRVNISSLHTRAKPKITKKRPKDKCCHGNNCLQPSDGYLGNQVCVHVQLVAMAIILCTCAIGCHGNFCKCFILW